MPQFDPTELHDAVTTAVLNRLSQDGINPSAVQIGFPPGEVIDCRYAPFNGTPLVQDFLTYDDFVLDTSDPSALPLWGSENFYITVDPYQVGGNLDISDAAHRDAQKIGQAVQDDFDTWLSQPNAEFYPGAALPTLITGATLMAIVFVALVWVLLSEGHNRRLTLLTIAAVSLVRDHPLTLVVDNNMIKASTALLLASSGLIQVVLNTIGHDFVPVGGVDDIHIGGTVHYSVHADFVARTWATAGLAVLQTLFCATLAAQPAPPEAWRPKWRGGDRLANRAISPPVDSSANAEAALEAREVPRVQPGIELDEVTLAGSQREYGGAERFSDVSALTPEDHRKLSDSGFGRRVL